MDQKGLSLFELPMDLLQISIEGGVLNGQSCLIGKHTEKAKVLLDWPLGMFSSIRHGTEHVRTSRFFIMLGDMPWTAPDVYRALLRHAPADFVYPVFDGRRGHPVLCSARVKEEVLRADPASGSMREIASRMTVRELSWGDDSIHRDIDTAEDLAR